VANDPLLRMNALLRYYFKIEKPEELPMDEWCLRVAELEYVRESERSKSASFFADLFKKK
jgi:hypothetical protein